MLRRSQLPIVGMGKFVMEGKLFPSSSQPERSVGMCAPFVPAGGTVYTGKEEREQRKMAWVVVAVG